MKYKRVPGLTAPFFLSSAAAVFYIGYSNIKKPEWLAALCFLLMLICIAFVLITGADALVNRAVNAFAEVRRALAVTHVSVMIEGIKGLNTEQLAFAMKAQQVIRQRLLPGNKGPVKMFVCDDDSEVPQDFVKQFLDKSTSTHCQPVGDYSDSQAREYAQSFTRFLVFLGLATPAVSNQSAAWIENVETVRKYFGV